MSVIVLPRFLHLARCWLLLPDDDMLSASIRPMNVADGLHEALVMTLTQLQVLVAVVDAGSFTRAAAALSLTQPGVSHAIAALERELGVRLLHRDRDRAVLSE